MDTKHRFKEERHHPRRRARLRGGKLADLKDKFLTDCTLFDVSEGGVGLLVPEDVILPLEVLLYDDRDKTLALARICWRNGKQIGIAYEVPPASVTLFKAQKLQALQFSRYAVSEDEARFKEDTEAEGGPKKTIA
ncbi:PilZ domain-containing protein [uncultured Roseibium sp.]|uniref:PilZ domain-containing protein n=1 Tax=uncultured Roseibium sp. TaxID=1936171 RepID=UPI00259A3CBD|nr:PilZ domain-containing protein [uncultured Roseibium sp.]